MPLHTISSVEPPRVHLPTATVINGATAERKGERVVVAQIGEWSMDSADQLARKLAWLVARQRDRVLRLESSVDALRDVVAVGVDRLCVVRAKRDRAALRLARLLRRVRNHSASC